MTNTRPATSAPADVGERRDDDDFAPRNDRTAVRETGSPRLRLRLRTVFVFVSLVILLLPAIGIYALRRHENTLVRQAESDVFRTANLVAASYRMAFGQYPQDDLTARSAALTADARPPWPGLDVAGDVIATPFPAAAPSNVAADPIALQVGNQMALLLDEAAGAVRAQAHLLDWRGVVVATTEGDIGRSLAHADEVGQALRGGGVASLRRTLGEGSAFLTTIVRGAALQIVVAVPVVLGDRLIAVVVMSRRSPDIIDSLMEKRLLLLQGAAMFFAIALAISIVTLRTLVLPIKRLSVATRRVSRGEAARFERGRPYRVREVADLADSIEVMVKSLQRRTRYIRDLAYSISHEFKTPIAAAQGAVELLRDDSDELTPAEVRHFAANIAADVQRLDRLTKRLLDLAQADMATVGEETTDVLATARSVDCAALSVANGEEVAARIAPASLRATLEILVSNALEHGASRIDIRAESNGDSVALWVSDDGPGIAPEDRARVFDPFYTTGRDRGGTGLGLAICRAFVDSSGGSIELAPSTQGATFKLTLRK